ncbi:hypothetical protein [Candidatus Regiella insecticola]|uniref:hypothetical protein n=1 Tax=Candidatus Regiella insecticola TaxID=138073 RepID=UPI001596D283|nr:hypothetical protein [Candidatus Regiella insecticola]
MLVLNNAQANMKIECKNKDTQWIIDAYHLSGIQSRFEVKQDGEVKIYFERVVNIGNNQSQQQTISILTIAHRATTKLIVQLAEGGFTVDLQALRLVPLVISITPIPGSDQQSHKISALKRYIQNHTVNFKETVKYIRIVGFNPSDEQRDFSLYDLQRELFLYTASDPESIFSGTLRKNCQLLFINQEYAWYQGDWVIPMDNVSNRVHIYENIIWVSEIKSHRLLQIYLPLGHLPNIQEREKQVFTSPSTVTAPRVMSQAIIFTQQYIYDNQTIKLKYCIDLSNPEKGLALTELTDLPGGISDQLIQSGNLENLVLFMKNQVQNRLLFSQLNNIDPWKRSGNNIKPSLCNGQTDTTLSIRNRLLWPLKNSMVVKGKIVANINNRHFFSRQLKPAGIVKARHPNKNHYFFWSLVTTHNNPFDTLYVQKGNNEAKVMDLTEFGLNQADIIHLKEAFITTKQGLIYRLSDDKTLTLAGIDEAFFSNYSDWSSALTIQIMQLQARLGDATLFPEGQKKAINIASHLTILGLLQCDEQRLLPLHAWYDRDSQQFIFCKSDPDQNMIFQGLSEDRKGAWLLNDKGENNKEIGYLPVIDKAFISTLFIGSILQHEDQLPTISMLKLDAAFGAGFINAKVMKQRKKIQGNIQGLTAKGMVITVSKTADNQFSVTLCKVTPLFTYQYGTDMPRLKIALKNLCDNLSQNYRYAEMIEVVLQNNQVGWYFPSKNILLTGLIQGDNCLGFNSDRRLAYFVNNQSGVFSVNQGGIRYYIDNSSYRYRRSNNILLLNSGSLVTLDVDAHINIDVPALAIMTSIDQSIIDTFRFDLTLFNYSIIYLFHLGKGLLYATLSPEIEPEDMTITRKSGFLVVFINNKLLVINDAFKPGKTSHPVYQHQTNHNKIKFVFSHRGTISVKQLVDHYIKTIGNEINDGSIVIPIPDIDLY